MYILITSGLISVTLWLVSGYLGGKIIRNQWKKSHFTWTLADEWVNRMGFFFCGLVYLFIAWLCKRSWKNYTCPLCRVGFIKECEDYRMTSVKSWF